MDPEPLQSLINACGGLIVVTVFGVLMFQVWRHRRPEGPMTRGITVKTEPLDGALVASLRAITGTRRTAWGWFRAEGGTLLVFVDPYYSGAGHLRIETLWPRERMLRWSSMSCPAPTGTPTLPVVRGPLTAETFTMASSR